MSRRREHDGNDKVQPCLLAFQRRKGRILPNPTHSVSLPPSWASASAIRRSADPLLLIRHPLRPNPGLSVQRLTSSNQVLSEAFDSALQFSFLTQKADDTKEFDRSEAARWVARGGRSPAGTRKAYYVIWYHETLEFIMRIL